MPLATATPAGFPGVCYRGGIRGSSDLSSRIIEDRDLSSLLADLFDFNVSRQAGADSPRLISGQQLKSIAGAFSGGEFYLCGMRGTRRPVLCASSEGEAGRIADDLRDALRLMIGFPYWRDALKYSANGDLASMEVATGFLWRDLLAKHPEIVDKQSRVAGMLGVDLDTPLELITRLHAVVKDAGQDFLFADDTGEYGSLFGPFPPSRNQRWQ
ncbi:hypothetical protein AB0P21_35610 [Kribbella sp. NPDC056861]|uniref:hypothetical protein n=1 Tax=Kribbella sp. NPDC056861 TaxID=3154857 RepID=UPI0034157875